MDPQDLIARFLDTTREASTRAADVEAIKDLLVGLPAGQPIGLQAADALRQVFLDSTEAAELRQAVAQAIYALPSQWRDSISGQIQKQTGIPFPLEDQLQRSLAHLRHKMTVPRLREVLSFVAYRDPRVLVVLAEAASHPDPAIRAEVQGGLVSYGEQGAVVQALHDEAPPVRAAATEALGYQGVERLGVEGLRALKRVLADPEQAVRGAAQVALRRLGVRPLPPPPLAPPVVPAPPEGPGRFAWAPFLTGWSWRLVQLEKVREDLPDAVIASGWLGYPGATDAQLAAAEQRLGRLPPSYREFLQVTNGWRLPFMMVSRLLPIEEVDLFLAKAPTRVEEWAELADHSEEEHRVYGAQQDTVRFRGAYLRSALQISEPSLWAGGDDTYLLNPEVVTPEGEWEAWLLSSQLAGAQRWPSFWEMLQDEAVTQFPGGLPREAVGEQEEPLPLEE